MYSQRVEHRCIHEPMTTTRQPGDRGLMLIGGFKLIEGSLLAVFALGVLRIPLQDLVDVIEGWKSLLHSDANSEFLGGLLQKLSAVSETELKQISGVILIFAGIFLTQGIGLMMKKRWAEYLTVIATGLVIPLELYEMIKHFAVAKLILLAINVAIVWFLIWVLRRRSGRDLEAA